MVFWRNARDFVENPSKLGHDDFYFLNSEIPKKKIKDILNEHDENFYFLDTNILLAGYSYLEELIKFGKSDNVDFEVREKYNKIVYGQLKSLNQLIIEKRANVIPEIYDEYFNFESRFNNHNLYCLDKINRYQTKYLDKILDSQIDLSKILSSNKLSLKMLKGSEKFFISFRSSSNCVLNYTIKQFNSKRLPKKKNVSDSDIKLLTSASIYNRNTQRNTMIITGDKDLLVQGGKVGGSIGEINVGILFPNMIGREIHHMDHFSTYFHN